ncbi:endo alpha-1,4 polygalactosaminidase [Chitinophaga qingshengii]|uniref:Endo alpha-1,4 polygalactosaminidase n=1 Tax=Chitinophaga qingshengii TaxID=1569794 RepID=A0ABR7TKL7_9BACT|nr:endo alpha-1,4 polygalactosaminidase [Chitinophaga qingshengii]MBC9930525.1 endo alpha-1,4 polygalactosaminidase [Chitinophaga qingshengii]
MRSSRSTLTFAMIGLLSLTACSKKETSAIDTGDKKTPKPGTELINYRQELRNFIQDISAWARTRKPGFIVVAQNSSELLTTTGNPAAPIVTEYIKALDGVGREELYYGYDNNDNVPTPAANTREWLSLCKRAAENHLTVMTTDYCKTPAYVAASYQKNEANGFISFATASRQLKTIPAGAPYHENANDINTLADARNFLYQINVSSDQYINNLKATNYDVLIIDAFPDTDGTTWTKDQINALKKKKNGGKRLVLAYMSIGQAEDYRWYWNPDWLNNPPAWFGKLDPKWEGNYNVRYWMPEWKAFIYGNADSYTQKILNAGFDGTYLDPVDASEYWEN